LNRPDNVLKRCRLVSHRAAHRPRYLAHTLAERPICLQACTDSDCVEEAADQVVEFRPYAAGRCRPCDNVASPTEAKEKHLKRGKQDAECGSRVRCRISFHCRAHSLIDNEPECSGFGTKCRRPRRRHGHFEHRKVACQLLPVILQRRRGFGASLLSTQPIRAVAESHCNRWQLDRATSNETCVDRG